MEIVGLVKNVHHPLDLMSASGRIEVMPRPKVGSVHRIAMINAVIDAAGLVSLFLAFAAAVTGGATSGVDVVGTLVVLIGPPMHATGGRCTRRSGRPG